MDGDIVVECDIMILGLGKQNAETVHGRYYEHTYAQVFLKVFSETKSELFLYKKATPHPAPQFPHPDP